MPFQATTLHRYSNNFHFPHVVVLCVQTTDDVIVGQTREKVNEFVYDYSYWSLDPNDPHFVPQEQVHTLSQGVSMNDENSLQLDRGYFWNHYSV